MVGNSEICGHCGTGARCPVPLRRRAGFQDTGTGVPCGDAVFGRRENKIFHEHGFAGIAGDHRSLHGTSFWIAL